MASAVFKNHFGKRVRPSPATASVITTGSQIRPRNEFGNPNRLDCHDEATLPQETTELISQNSLEVEFLAKVMASTESTNDAPRLRMEEMSIAK